MAGLEGDEEPPSIERHIHYNKRGELRMVGEKSLFDLDEPIWHADEKVGGGPRRIAASAVGVWWTGTYLAS